MSTNLSEDDVRRIVRDELTEQLGAIAEGPIGNGNAPDPVEQMAESVMTVRDLRKQDRDDLSAAETIRRSYGVDPDEYDDLAELQAEVRDRRGTA